MWSAIQNSNPTFEWELPIHLNPQLNTCSSNTASSQVDFGLDLFFSSSGLWSRFAFSSPPDHLERFYSRLAYFPPSLWNVVDVQLKPSQPEPPVQFAEGAIRGK